MAKKKITKVLIIGSNSFSAGSLINLLISKNFKVFAISRSILNPKKFTAFKTSGKNFSFKKMDINKDYKKISSYINKIKPKYILNYASQSMVGESWDNPIDWYQTNSLSMVKLYYAISKVKFNCRLIHISTPEVYGNLSKITFENNEYNPTTPYAASRVTADHFLSLLFSQKKINYSSVRSSNVYGEHQRLYRIVPKTIFFILKKKKLNLHGGGTSKRNFIHIDDVSLATLKVMISGKNGECYHISGNNMISIRNLVKKICEKMNYNFNKLVKFSNERKGKDKTYSLSSKKIRTKLKWKQKITLDKGLDRCIGWIKTNLKDFSDKDLEYTHKR
jgi:dTDP-glucose 4,6-dehydratase